MQLIHDFDPPLSVFSESKDLIGQPTGQLISVDISRDQYGDSMCGWQTPSRDRGDS